MTVWIRLSSFQDTDKQPPEPERQFAIRIGVKPETLRSWRRGYEPHLSTLERIAERLDVSFWWLAFGIGPKQRAKAEEWVGLYDNGEPRNDCDCAGSA